MANPNHFNSMRMPLVPYGYNPRFQQRASDPSGLSQQFMMWLMANQIAQQSEATGGGDDEVVQSTETVEQPAKNPYLGDIFRPSPRVGSLSPIGRYNDMKLRMDAEEKQRWANARAAAAQTYANQPPPSQGEVTDLGHGAMIAQTPYGSGGSYADPTLSYPDFLAQRHHDKWNPMQKPPEVIDDPSELEEIARITKQVLGGRRR